jgi:hypothetical protein
MDEPLPSRNHEGPGMPRWVRVFLIVAALLVLAFIALHLVSGGFRNHLH